MEQKTSEIHCKKGRGYKALAGLMKQLAGKDLNKMFTKIGTAVAHLVFYLSVIMVGAAIWVSGDPSQPYFPDAGQTINIGLYGAMGSLLLGVVCEISGRLAKVHKALEAYQHEDQDNE